MPSEVGPGQGLGMAQRDGTVESAGSQWEIFQTLWKEGENVYIELGRACFGLNWPWVPGLNPELDKVVLGLRHSDLICGQQLFCPW